MDSLIVKRSTSYLLGNIIHFRLGGKVGYVCKGPGYESIRYVSTNNFKITIIPYNTNMKEFDMSRLAEVERYIITEILFFHIDWLYPIPKA